MKTQLVRNALTLSELERLKVKLDGDIEETLSKLISDFENTTKVAVKKVYLSWNNSIDMPIKACIEIKLDLF